MLSAAGNSAGTLGMLDGVQLVCQSQIWPKEALASIADLLTELLEHDPELRLARVNPWPDRPDASISELPLRDHARQWLGRSGLHSISDTTELTWAGLLAHRGIGIRCLLDLTIALQADFIGFDDNGGVRTELADRVLRIWSETTGIDLTDEQGRQFNELADELQLRDWSDWHLEAAATRTFTEHGELRLAEWAAALDGPDLRAVKAVPQSWDDDREAQLDVLREALAHLLTSGQKQGPVKVLTQYFGVGGVEPRTLSEIGIGLGVSRERARQLRETALTALFHEQRATPLARALRTSVQAVLAGAASRDETAIEVLRGALPTTPVRKSMRLLSHLLQPHRERRRELLKALSAAYTRLVREEEMRFAAERRDLKLRKRARERIDTLCMDTWWPAAPCPVADLDVQPMRMVGNGEVPPHSLWSDKLGRKVGAESELELAFYQLCELNPDIEWYCEQPLRIGYDLDGQPRHYYPDTMLKFTDGRIVLVEVKQPEDVATLENQAKFEAARHWCEEHGVGLLITDGRLTTRSAYTHEVDPDLVARIGGRLAVGPMTWREAVLLRAQHPFTQLDLAAAVLQQGWELRLQPWILSLPATETSGG